MAEQRHGVVADREAVEEVGRLGVGGVDAGRLSCSTSTGPTLVKSKKLVMSKFIGVPSGPTQMPSEPLVKPLLCRMPSPLAGLNSRVLYCLQQVLAGVVEDLRAYGYCRAAAGPRCWRPRPGEVDDLVAIDVRADRPANILVGGRAGAGVDVQRVRPPVL